MLGVTAVNASGHLPGKEFAAVGISGYGAVSVVLAMIFLKEKVSAGQWAGIAMIVGGVAAVSTQAEKSSVADDCLLDCRVDGRLSLIAGDANAAISMIFRQFADFP